MITVRLLDYRDVLFHSESWRNGCMRIESSVHVVIADCLGRSIDVGGAAELNSRVVVIDGVCVDRRWCEYTRAKVALIAVDLHVFAWAEWHNDFDWTAEANNSDATAFSS